MDIVKLVKAIFDTVIKAQTLFMYSIIKWLQRIDAHKVFLCLVNQIILTILILMAWALTAKSGCDWWVVAILILLIEVLAGFIILGCPLSMREIKYVIFGDKNKYSEAQTGQMQKINKVKSGQQANSYKHQKEDELKDEFKPEDLNIDVDTELPVCDKTKGEMNDTINAFNDRVEIVDRVKPKDRTLASTVNEEELTSKELIGIASAIETLFDESDVVEEKHTQTTNHSETLESLANNEPVTASQLFGEDLQWNSIKKDDKPSATVSAREGDKYGNNSRIDKKIPSEKINTDTHTSSGLPKGDELNNVFSDDSIFDSIKRHGIDNNDDAVFEIQGNSSDGSIMGDIPDEI